MLPGWDDDLGTVGVDLVRGQRIGVPTPREPQSTGGVILEARPRLDRHLPKFTAIRTHLSHRFYFAIDFLGRPPRPEQVYVADHQLGTRSFFGTVPWASFRQNCMKISLAIKIKFLTVIQNYQRVECRRRLTAVGESEPIIFRQQQTLR